MVRYIVHTVVYKDGAIHIPLLLSSVTWCLANIGSARVHAGCYMVHLRGPLTKVSSFIQFGLHHESFDETGCFLAFSQELLDSSCIGH